MKKERRQVARSGKAKRVNNIVTTAKRAATAGLLAVITLFPAACGNDSPGDDTPVAACFSAGIDGLASRAADTWWHDGDLIGITGTSGSGEYKNIAHVVTDAATNTFTPVDDDNTIYFNDDDDVTFTAYYPHAGTSGTAEPSLSGSTDATYQMTEKQPRIDYLFAKAKGSQSAPDVKFTFTHSMSRVTLSIKAGEGIASLASMTNCTLDGFYLHGSFDPATGTAAAVPSGNPESIDNPFFILAEGQKEATSSLILYPQDATKATFSVILGNQTFTADLTVPDGKLEPGTSYAYNVTVSRTGITVSKATIGKWTDKNGDAAEAK